MLKKIVKIRDTVQQNVHKRNSLPLSKVTLETWKVIGGAATKRSGIEIGFLLRGVEFAKVSVFCIDYNLTPS